MYVRTLNEKSDAIYDTVRGPSYGTTRIGTIMRNFVIKNTFISTFSERKKKLCNNSMRKIIQ